MKYNELEKELKSLIGKEGISEGYVDLHIELQKALNGFQKKLGKVEFEKPEKTLLNSEFRGGKSLLQFLSISISLKSIQDYCEIIFPLFKSKNALSVEFIKWFESQKDSESFKTVFNNYFSQNFDALNSFAEKEKLDLGSILIFCLEAVKPFLRNIAHQIVEKGAFDDWTKGYCPICSGNASFSRFSKKEEGKRYLWCSKCDIEWNYSRLACPHCGTTDQKSLKFLTTDHREELRIDTCKSCNGYIKSLDENKIKEEREISYIVENISSLFLDVVAEEEGLVVKYTSKPDILVKL